MKIYEEYKGLKNVIIQYRENKTDFFVFNNLQTFFVKHFIVDEINKTVEFRFDIIENQQLFNLVISAYPNYEILDSHFNENENMILVNKGLFTIIADKENIIHNNELADYIPFIVSYEKEKYFKIRSNSNFSFTTEDGSDSFCVPKSNQGVMTFSKALAILSVMKLKRETSDLRYKLHSLGISNKELKKMKLEELKNMYETKMQEA